MSRVEEFNMDDYVWKTAKLKDSTEDAVIIQEVGKMGFFFEDDKDINSKVSFEPNIFADYMIQAVNAVRDENDNIYLYHKRKKHYVEVRTGLLKMLCMDIMNQLCDLWDLYRESVGLETFRHKVRITVKSFSSSEWLNLKNGLFNIKEMQLEKHTPLIRLATQLPITYDPSANCPRFMQFMDEITGKDQELIDVLQEIVGYCLCYSVKAEKAFLFYGNGKNGKSVLAKVMEQLAGEDNVSHVMLSDLNSNFGLEPMVNKTLNIAAETELTRKFNTGLFKSIVSGDSVSVNQKYKKVVSQKLYCKMVFLCNTLPEINDTTYGFSRKLMIVPFDVTISDEQEDVNLYAKLRKELPGIFNWALVGLQRLIEQKYKFSSCKAIDACGKTYQGKINPTGLFWQDTYQEDPNGRLVQSEIYPTYCKWAENNNAERISLKRFWELLRAESKAPGSPIKFNEKKVNGKRCLDGYSRIHTENKQPETNN